MTTDYAGWLTKEAAADALATSPKTIERLVQRGELRQENRRVPGRRPLPVYDPEGVERLRLQTIATVEPGASTRTGGARNGDAAEAVARVLEALPAMIGAAVAEVVRADRLLGTGEASDPEPAGTPREKRGARPASVVALSEKLVLTLSEAAELAGIPRTRLLAAIKAGELVGHLGGPFGPGWRVKRVDLEAYVTGLMAS